MIHAPNEMFGCKHLCPPSGWFWASPDSAVMIYPTNAQTGQLDTGSFSWDVVVEFDGKWYDIAGGGATTVGNAASIGSLVSYVSQPIPASSLSFRYGIKSGYVLTVGQSLTPSAWSADLQYDTGQTIHQPLIVSKDGATAPFGVVAKAKTLCSIRLFDQNGALLQQLDAQSDTHLAFDIQRYAPGSCGS